MQGTSIFRAAAAALLVAGSILPAHALDLRPDGASFELAAGTRDTRMAGVGLIWDWDFERMRRKSELTAHTELLLNRWRADTGGGSHLSLTQVVLLPTLRMRLAQGRSPWFFELGVGASWMDRSFVTPQRQFSTRWNFYDVLGVGHSFGGPDGRHELGVRWVHVSNLGLRKPNPGQDFLQLRYVARF